MQHTISSLAKEVNGTVVGKTDLQVGGVTGFDQPKAGCITFITNPKDLAELEQSDIACIIVPRQVASSQKPLIQVENPKLAFARLLTLFYPPRTYSRRLSPQAIVSATAKIGKNVTIEAFASIGEQTVIGDGSTIRSGAFVDDYVSIGADTIIHANVSIYHHVQIGNRVIIHSGAVIGSDGFGYVFDGKCQVKIPQVGTVVIEDEVEIGAASTIDRAATGETRIGLGTKIDNQVQIAHNVQIGAHSAISAKCGISGSCKIGNYVTMGGGVGIADHVEVGDGAMLGANAGVPPGKKIPPKTIWFGQPARPYQEMRKQFGAQLRAYENQEDLRELRKKIAAFTQELEALKANLKT